MATLYGGAMPDDFVSGEELTATEFNKVKNYWIVDGDLPEGPEILDGDVVFVLGDGAAVGTADITAITGSGITHTYGDFVAFEFLTSGSLTCTEGLIPEALLVGGGGGGANYVGAGGAGGHLEITNAYFSAANHNVVVGQGGVGPSVTNINGVNGDSSIIASTYYALGGGGGGMRNFGVVGGSGGSVFGDPNGYLSGAAGTPGQGNAGGDSVTGANGNGGGGGGAGSVGVNTSGYDAGAGGAGASSSITGSAVTRAGGGGGGSRFGSGAAGGSGGGGAGGAENVSGTAGTANTGGGGGASGYLGASGGDGGSGVVIVKVKASNAVNVDKSGWTEVTALMLAAAEKKRELERKAKQAAIVLEKKNEELSGATQMDIEGDLI